ncbi:hypothetical protein SAMN04487854_107104 [Pseudoalteromonas lipolytica]|uniref:Uncharacterized protein n=2 Tax=Pseudoalteromonas lipolytica TaxID=570156 RepID=A0ABY1GHC9_9GAMM|nr:hypothetical protein [Pseudoalteromonas lipolytica]MBE0350279.1 hypothetical protein [Pseudoalteromonas lipolytica LMEB 39]SFT69346.1 hypothetical protein SAMN04487854_107104 [Pseudoalteromonas lipolytica]
MAELLASNTSKYDFLSVVSQGELTAFSNLLAEIDFTNTGVIKDGMCSLVELERISYRSEPKHNIRHVDTT